MLRQDRKTLSVFVVSPLVVLGLLAAMNCLFADRVQLAVSKYQQEIWDQKRDVSESRLLIMGDSSASVGLLASEFDWTTSLAANATTYMETYFTLRRYLQDNPPPRCILLANAYTWRYHFGDRFWYFNVVQGYYSIKDALEIAYRYGGSQQPPMNGQSGLSFLAKYFYYRFFYFGGTLEVLLNLDEKNRVAEVSMKRIIDHRGSNPRSVMPNLALGEEIVRGYDKFPFSPSQIADEYLLKLLELTKENAIWLYMTYMPVSKRLGDKPSYQDFRRQRRGHIGQLLGTYEHVEYFSRNRVEPDIEKMADDLHLKKNKAKAFSKLLKGRLGRCF